MLTVNLICVGKLKEKFLLSAQDEYKKRLALFCKLNLIELNENKLGDNPSEASIKNSLNIEATEILKRVKGYVVALCIEGKIISSEELSNEISKRALNGISEITFIIGSSFGMSEEIKDKADLRLSMSKMTFPHHLARIMLLEQIYRSFSIQNNTKYHK